LAVMKIIGLLVRHASAGLAPVRRQRTEHHRCARPEATPGAARRGGRHQGFSQLEL
jgi:hypothetical protein